MEQKTGIRSLYDEFFRGYGAEMRLICPDVRPNSTYKPTYTRCRAVMRLILRLALTLVLVAIAAFCCFGFMASYEIPDFLMFRWLYAAVFIACVAAIVWVVKATRRQA